MHNLRLIRRRFPEHKETIIPLMFVFFGSAFMVGLGLAWFF